MNCVLHKFLPKAVTPNVLTVFGDKTFRRYLRLNSSWGTQFNPSKIGVIKEEEERERDLSLSQCVCTKEKPHEKIVD